MIKWIINLFSTKLIQYWNLESKITKGNSDLCLFSNICVGYVHFCTRILWFYLLYLVHHQIYAFFLLIDGWVIITVEGVDPERREKLIDLLDIDLEWRMHVVSDGQMRHVQICMGLLQPYKVSCYFLVYFHLWPCTYFLGIFLNFPSCFTLFTDTWYLTKSPIFFHPWQIIFSQKSFSYRS